MSCNTLSMEAVTASSLKGQVRWGIAQPSLVEVSSPWKEGLDLDDL